jgi:hypothetical protein
VAVAIKATEFVGTFGVRGRAVREAIALLTEGAPSLAQLVRATALPRRTVEELLDALAEDLASDGSIRPDRVAAYREAFGYGQLRRTALPDPLAARLSPELVGELERLVTGAPTGRQALDHVAATATTVARRALWLDSTFDLAGANVLCVGDHDLSSLALRLVNPDVAVTVVDVDERVLAHLDEQGLGVRCLYSDLRLGLPAEASEWADLVVTDPPYTPDGVRLFLARGLQGLRDHDHGRLVLAYGFGDRQPALGLKVQQAIGQLQLAYEAILPGFNRYHGAQAVGSASDLYVCQPTARTWKALDPAIRESVANIYTHGAQSVEGTVDALESTVADAVLAAAAGEAGLPVPALIGDRWPRVPAGSARLGLAPLVHNGLPANLVRREPFGVALDLGADPGPWLLRALLATNATRVAILVPNGHPDLADARAQRSLIDLVGSKYQLRFRRSFPDPRHAIVEASSTSPDSVARLVLERAYGKAANSWREGLIRATGGTLTKNEARAAIAEASRRPDLLDSAPISLPRHQLTALLADIANS